MVDWLLDSLMVDWLLVLYPGGRLAVGYILVVDWLSDIS